jgi:hypothetical protein
MQNVREKLAYIGYNKNKTLEINFRKIISPIQVALNTSEK